MLAGRQALELKTLSIRRGSGERGGRLINVKLLDLLAMLGPSLIKTEL